MKWKILCFARSVHQCILASYGGMFLYKACINWMSRIIMLLDSCTICPRTAVQVWCLLSIECLIVERSSGTESMDSWRDWYLLLMHLSSLRSLVMPDTVLRLFATGWNYCMYILMVVEIACAVISLHQFCHFFSFVVSIIMLVSGYIAQLCNAILCVLWAFVIVCICAWK